MKRTICTIITTLALVTACSSSPPADGPTCVSRSTGEALDVNRCDDDLEDPDAVCIDSESGDELDGDECEDLDDTANKKRAKKSNHPKSNSPLVRRSSATNRRVATTERKTDRRVGAKERTTTRKKS